MTLILLIKVQITWKPSGLAFGSGLNSLGLGPVQGYCVTFLK